MSGSPRKGGNTDLLCDQFAKGVMEAGHYVAKVWVVETNIHPCIAAMADAGQIQTCSRSCFQTHGTN